MDANVSFKKLFKIHFLFFKTIINTHLCIYEVNISFFLPALIDNSSRLSHSLALAHTVAAVRVLDCVARDG